MSIGQKGIFLLVLLLFLVELGFVPARVFALKVNAALLQQADKLLVPVFVSPEQRTFAVAAANVRHVRLLVNPRLELLVPVRRDQVPHARRVVRVPPVGWVVRILIVGLVVGLVSLVGRR